jgi:hypothetical protein
MAYRSSWSRYCNFWAQFVHSPPTDLVWLYRGQLSNRPNKVTHSRLILRGDKYAYSYVYNVLISNGSTIVRQAIEINESNIKIF